MSKFLDITGVGTLWGKVKDLVKTSVTDKLGAANGIATLGADSKLTASQLPALKTVNGESIVGSGNITIDLGIYQVVDTLPESNQNANKIYLVLTSPATGQEQNVYTEFIWVNNKWETLGEYHATVDLEPYVKKADLDSLVAAADYAKKNEVDGLAGAAGYLKTANLKSEADKLGYATQSFVGEKVAEALTGGEIDITGYIKEEELGDKVAGLNFVKFSDVASGTKAGVMSTAQFNKLEGIEANATADSAIGTEELNSILV